MTKTKLQIMREKKGLTVKQLALKIYTAYQSVESSNSTISLSEFEEVIEAVELGSFWVRPQKLFFELIAQALGCSVDELVEE